jgi:hypothetical protein
VKQPNGSHWLTVPVLGVRSQKLISEMEVDDAKPWRQSHLDCLANCYRKAPYFREMMNVVESVFSIPTNKLSDVTVSSTKALANYFEIDSHVTYVAGDALGAQGKKTDKVLDYVQKVQGNIYLTGHGAANYLEHEMLEEHGIHTEYIKYQLKPYPQLNGAFTPYVSALDLVANMGKAGRELIVSGSVPWREFINERASTVS